MTDELQASMAEVIADVSTVIDALSLENSEAKVLVFIEKYSKLVLMRETLPHALIALQYHTTTPKGKEALHAALRILAQARGAELPEKSG